MKALVVGFGSIGARHTRLLVELGCATAVVSAQELPIDHLYKDLTDAVEDWAPDYIVVANTTAQHHDIVKLLAQLDYRGIVMVEKPLFHRLEPMIALPFRAAYVAYNLRFHPLVQRLHSAIAGQHVVAANCYVGQYLPSWRPGTDYSASYSSSRMAGGGVLRDLSHELDYLGSLLGPWQRVSAIGGHFSALDGDSDDVFGLLMEYRGCPLVQLHMNYLDRVGRRSVLINTNDHTIAADFVAGTFAVDGDMELVRVDRDHTYREMHRAALGGVGGICGFSEGMDTLALIDAAEHSAASRRMVNRQ